jgi:hypothetical protein
MRIATILLLAAFTLACGTVQRGVEAPQQRGFLAGSYDRLRPGTGGEAALVYVREDAAWQSYQGILLDPVQYWDEPDGELRPDVQQMLTSYFDASVREHLKKEGFQLAELPGPGVVRVQLALLDASAATPVLRSVSLVVPFALVLNTAQRVVTDKYTFSGQIEAAMKVTDAQSGELLAAALDRRAGGANPKAVVQWEWGDAKAAIDHWAEQFARRMQELRGRIEAS